MSEEENQGKSGASGGTPAPLFETIDGDERALEDSNPFQFRRGGSRRGVPNRRTEDFKRYYASLGLADPLLFLGHVISQKSEDLARELSCKKAAALDIQRKAAADLAPYLHSKQPAKLELGEGELLPMLVIGKAERAAVRDQVAAGAMSIDGDFEDEEKQPLTRDAGAGSHGDGSHGDGEGA